ncbi:radical SAM family heme chaperone HemW [Candidatus Dependentiae bacterium]|nr:radical SAM family heme chaperone HemW [Candidatus Dependentiae bacterium]
MYFDLSVNPSSLYIHWPFCPYKCHFCNFVAIAGHEEYMHDYHLALKSEIERFCSERKGKLSIDTIYMGGGTPSTYPLSDLLDTSGTLYKVIDFLPGYEWTIEVNPGTVTDEHFRVWRDIGINRISIGVQSLNSAALKKLNRHQSLEDVHSIIDKAHHFFRTVSVDLILGLPGVSVEQWKDALAKIVHWPIKQISMYFLMVHEATPLYFGVKKKSISLPCDDEVVDLYHWSVAYLAEHGFAQYEISSFAKSGFESKHNKAYWQRKPFKGFGLGAFSFDGMSRTENEKNLLAYMDKVKQQEPTEIMVEKLSREQIWLETLMLGLRQPVGVKLSELLTTLQEKERETFICAVSMLQERHLVRSLDDRLFLTPQALAVENEVIEKLSVF